MSDRDSMEKLREALDEAERFEAPADGIAYGDKILRFSDIRALLALAERAQPDAGEEVHAAERAYWQSKDAMDASSFHGRERTARLLKKWNDLRATSQGATRDGDALSAAKEVGE